MLQQTWTLSRLRKGRLNQRQATSEPIAELEKGVATCKPIYRLAPIIQRLREKGYRIESHPIDPSGFCDYVLISEPGSDWLPGMAA